MKELTVDKKDAGQRLDKYLKKYFKNASAGFLYKMLRKKNITFNGKKAEGKELLQSTDKIQVFFSDETFEKMAGISTAMSEQDDFRKKFLKAYDVIKNIRVLYENEDLLFLYKPAGVLSQMADAHILSANEWICGYLEKEGKQPDYQTFRPGICNRLDRNTSGILMAAKTYAGSRALSAVIKYHQVRKYYLAIAEGRVEQDCDLEGYLYKNEAQNKVIVYATKEDVPTHCQEQASYIRTKYRIRDYCDKYTLLEVELITGKSHQIRAHLASCGHPIAGDIKYGGHPYHGRNYQQLHAYRLVFQEDADLPGMESREITCPPESDFWLTE